MVTIPPRLTTLAETLVPAPVLRRARVSYFDRRRRRYPRRVVEHLYAGSRHRVLIASDYGERYDQDWPELAEMQWLRRGRLQPGARVFDLGASYGVIAMMLADAVGREGTVVALEALPDDAAILARNRELNDLPQLHCLHSAVARRSGTVAFGRHGAVDDGTGRWGELRIPAHSIDDLAARYGVPDVVFIDIEGYELEALRGAPQTLAAGPEWFVEVHAPEQLGAYGATTQQVLDCFVDAGYAVWTLPDAGYTLGPDGRLQARGQLRALADTPPEMLDGRFFALASRER